MKLVTAVLFALSVIGSAQAAAPDACTKDCRDYHRACVKAHSQEACKTDYDICVKACRRK